VGFLEYASSIFFEKDWLKTRLLTSPRFLYPQLVKDAAGWTCILPEPTINEDKETVSLVGYEFPADAQGKKQLVSLFRAAVFHLSAHISSYNPEDYVEWKKGKNPRLAMFTTSIVEDARAVAYVLSRYPDKLHDLAFANALALKRLRPIDRLINPATRLMAGLLLKMHTGFMKARMEKEHKTIVQLAGLLDQFRTSSLVCFADGKVGPKEDSLKVADEIYYAIEGLGVVTEVPFLPHTEESGVCSTFSPNFLISQDVSLENDLQNCLKLLGGASSNPEGAGSSREKVAEAEADQIIGSWKHQKEKNKRTVLRYESFLSLTRFKSVEIPEQDYTEFLRVQSRCKTESHRLIESLLVARDAIDEDPRKMYGVLDLQEVIQVIASKSPRLDVFQLDENLSKSYSWVILLDVSRSMRYNKDFAMELLVMLADVANEILLDPGSWGVYAFNDRFHVVKDPKERYNAGVKSRIGGLRFEGFTYLPDALAIAGKIVKSRAENMRLITVISDGWSYGYTDINEALLETIRVLEGGSISLIGVGAKSNRMQSFFRSNCSVHELRDLTKRFSNLYFEASKIAAET
jgi:hypothetical protein